MSQYVGFHTKIFFITLFFLGAETKATNYYFSSTLGDDSRMSIEAKNPDTPWRSLAKFNEISGSLSPGDTVLFRCGEKFFGQLLLRKSGTIQRPIVITSYGNGAAPEISGWVTLDSPELISESIKRFDLSNIKLNSSNSVKTVMVEGDIRGKGRYPNDGYLIYHTVGKDNYFTYDNMAEISHFVGAELVMRMNEWIFDRARINNTDDQGVSFSKETNYAPSNKYGFFIQDHFKTLDKHGEWFHDSENNALFVYLDRANNDEAAIEISTVDYLLTNENALKNVKIEGLAFSGSTKSAIFFEQGENISIMNCSIKSAGEDGIRVINVANMTISGNTISDTFENGIFLRYGTPNSSIVNNQISNINLFAGMSKSGDQTGIGIYSRSDSTKIKGNKLNNIGYTGIFFGGNHTIVERNLVDGFCLIKNDGGGIYTYEGKRNQSFANRIVRSNTIINGIGTREGNKFSNSIEHPQVEGIYIDDNASGVLISNNKIGSVSRNGINLHNAREINIYKNTVFDCPNLLSFSHDNLGEPIDNVHVTENRLIAVTDNQKSIKLTSNLVNLLDKVIFKDNIYHHPISNDFFFQLNELSMSSTEWSKHEPSHKTNPLQPGKSTASGSFEFHLAKNNLLDNQSTRINALNKECNIERSKDFITITTNEPMTGVRIDLPEVRDSRGYSLKMIAKTESNLVVQAYLRTAGAPWSTVSETHAFKLAPSNQGKLVHFSNVSSTVKPVLMLKVQNKSAVFHILDLQWIETESSALKPSINLRLNDSGLLEEIQIDGQAFYLND